jgi:hypothetical protein
MRNLATAPKGAAGCEAMQQWAEDKASGKPQREGESSAQDDAIEAASCWRRQKNDARARASLLSGLFAESRGRVFDARAGGFDDPLARKVAALALSAHAAGEQDTFGRAQALLQQIRGRDLQLEQGDRKAVGGAGEAVSMVDGDCFFCARTEAYGASDGEHVEELGRWAGLAYVRRDDGREQFLVGTRLIGGEQLPPQQLFADAMRRRGRQVVAMSTASLAARTPGPGEDAAADAPLFNVPLRGFAFGDVRRAEEEAGTGDGLHVVLRTDSGELVVRFPPLLLQRAARDKRFVAPPDGVDAVVRYEGKDGDRPRYRAVILRVEDGVAEGP